MINYIIFGLVSLSFIFVSLSILFIWKEKEFEDKRLKKSLNGLLVGMMFLAIFLLSKAVEYFLIVFGNRDISFIVGIIEVVSLSLMSILFLVSMIFMREI